MRYRFSALLLIAGVTVFHLWYIASGRIDLAPAEAHYWEWSRRLDWSYYSKGPMVAYLIAVTTRLGVGARNFSFAFRRSCWLWESKSSFTS